MKAKVIIFFLLISLLSCNRREDNAEYIDDHNIDRNETSEEKNNSNPEQNINEEKTTQKPVAVISPLEAGDYIGKTVTVKGFIADVYKNEKVAYLNFVEKFPRNPFTAVIFASSFDLFGDVDLYKTKNVEVTGLVSIYKNKPQIILKSKTQIKIIG